MNLSTERSALRVASIGYVVFAATLIAIGIEALIRGDFDVIWQPVPKWVPAREVLKLLCAFIPLVCGIALIWRRAAAIAARVLLGFALLWLLLVRVPHVVLAPNIGTVWSVCKVAVFAAAAWVLYGKHLRIARVLYGLALIPFGIAHFAYLQQTAVLVPAWLPWHVAWSYLTGATFILAGVAIVLGLLARWAAVLSAWQIGLITLLVWVPVVIAGHVKPFQWSEFVVSCVLTACAWVIADSYCQGGRSTMPAAMSTIAAS